MASTDAFAVAILGMLVYGLGRGFSGTSTMPILCHIVRSRYPAAGYGFLNLFSTFAGGATIYVGGALRDGQVNLSKVFQFSAVGLVVAGLTLLLIRLAPATEESWRIKNNASTPT